MIEEVPDEDEHLEAALHVEDDHHHHEIVHDEDHHTEEHHLDADVDLEHDFGEGFVEDVPVHEYPVFSVEGHHEGHSEFSNLAPLSSQQDSLTMHEQWKLPHAFDASQVIYSDHYTFRNDLYTHADFPYDDLYFESYHYMLNGNRHLPPVPLAIEPELYG